MILQLGIEILRVHKTGSYSVLDIPEANKKLVLTWGETFNECFMEMRMKQLETIGNN